eukprot:36977-Pleurochrysis_carterae.AAC.1
MRPRDTSNVVRTSPWHHVSSDHTRKSSHAPNNEQRVMDAVCLGRVLGCVAVRVFCQTRLLTSDLAE